MKLLFSVFVALLLAIPAQAFHKPNHAPPGLALPLCGCLAVEIQESVYFNREKLVANPNLRDIVGGLMVLGEMTCTGQGPDYSLRGEAMLRAILVLLDDIQTSDQDFCR